MRIIKILQSWKYEILLVAIIQHLYFGILLTDMLFYAEVIWPINMLLLGVASVGVFAGKGKWKNIARLVLFFIVLMLPIGYPIFGAWPSYFLILNIIYVGYFVFILYEVLKFLIRPGYINADIISASGCGYFLLIEIFVFLLQYFEYKNPNSFNNIDKSSTASIYIDLVYFCSITITSIGFGDITPKTYNTKLITSLFGIIGQFYSVVLVGILISKFTSKTKEH